MYLKNANRMEKASVDICTHKCVVMQCPAEAFHK